MQCLHRHISQAVSTHALMVLAHPQKTLKAAMVTSAYFPCVSCLANTICMHEGLSGSAMCVCLAKEIECEQNSPRMTMSVKQGVKAPSCPLKSSLTSLVQKRICW